MRPKLRKCQYKIIKNNGIPPIEYELKDGYFHQWSMNYEVDGQPFPVAIIEHEDGTVNTVFAEYVKFI